MTNRHLQDATERARRIEQEAGAAVEAARKKHQQAGVPMAGWRDGRVVIVEPVTLEELVESGAASSLRSAVGAVEGKDGIMTAIDLKGRSGSDRILHLDIPVGESDRDYRVTVLIEPAEASPPDTWPEGFFESTFGQWTGDFDIDSEGEFENRAPL